MTRRIVYGISLWVFLGAAACTLAAIALPNWITYHAPVDAAGVSVSYGLHKRCSSLTGQCKPFPAQQDCVGTSDRRFFCSMWRSTGFFMNFTVVLQLACLIAYLTILVGGRITREAGWKLLAGLLGVVAAGQLIAMALVVGFLALVLCCVRGKSANRCNSQAYLFNHDKRFFDGWFLDKSWVLCTVSWVTLVLNALSIVGAGIFLPKDDDYEPIPN